MARSTRKGVPSSPPATPLPFPLARERAVVLATVFLTGAGVLVLELAGSRVVAPLYGSGLYSWSALISVTLAALSLGYWVGGRVADRRPDLMLFHAGILVAGLLVVVIPWAARVVLRVTEPLDPRLGVLLAATLLFFPALTVLGGTTPFAIRLSKPPTGEVGSASGQIFAVSTIGSLLAALTTGFVLIPNLGVRSILGLTGLVLMLTAGAGFLVRRSIARVVAAALLAVSTLVAWRGLVAVESPGNIRIVARTPSFFGYLRVVETSDFRMLTVNGISQNYVPLAPGGPTSPYLNFVGALPRLLRGAPSNPSVLLIGLGAGELVGRLEAAGARLTVVEIDPRVEEAARRHFGLELSRDRIHIEDGRAFLERDTAQYDYVILDAFLGEDVPAHLYTQEALTAMRRRLRSGGLLVINYTSFPNGADARSLARTLRTAFPHVRAFNNGTQDAEMASNVFLASAGPIGLNDVDVATVADARLFLANEVSFPEAGSALLTDDYNPMNVYRLGATRVWRRSLVKLFGNDLAYWADF